MTINIGAEPNDGQGDSIRVSYTKTNENFNELYSRLQPAPTINTGSTGDVAGMIAVQTDPTKADFSKFYYCFQDYDGSSEIWKVLSGSTF